MQLQLQLPAGDVALFMSPGGRHVVSFLLYCTCVQAFFKLERQQGKNIGESGYLSEIITVPALASVHVQLYCLRRILACTCTCRPYTGTYRENRRHVRIPACTSAHCMQNVQTVNTSCVPANITGFAATDGEQRLTSTVKVFCAWCIYDHRAHAHAICMRSCCVLVRHARGLSAVPRVQRPA